MRISDWSSDVCSSDLGELGPIGRFGQVDVSLHAALLLVIPVHPIGAARWEATRTAPSGQARTASSTQWMQSLLRVWLAEWGGGATNRKGVEVGKRVCVRVDRGGLRLFIKQQQQ